MVTEPAPSKGTLFSNTHTAQTDFIITVVCMLLKRVPGLGAGPGTTALPMLNHGHLHGRHVTRESQTLRLAHLVAA